jgi:hypothetical protein
MIAMSGTIPDPPATSSSGSAAAASHTKKPPIGPRTSNLSPGTCTSCRNGETSPSVTRSTVISIWA